MDVTAISMVNRRRRWVGVSELPMKSHMDEYRVNCLALVYAIGPILSDFSFQTSNPYVIHCDLQESIGKDGVESYFNVAVSKSV